MTTADALVPSHDQTIAGVAEVIVRGWRRTMSGEGHQLLDQEKAARGRANALKNRKRINE